MVTWRRIGAVAAAMVLSAGTTAYASAGKDKDKESEKKDSAPRQLVVMSATVDRQAQSVTLRGQNFGSSEPKVFCETYPLTVLQFTDTQVVVWFPGSVPEGTYLFSVLRGRGQTDFERTVFYVNTPAVDPSSETAR